MRIIQIASVEKQSYTTGFKTHQIPNLSFKQLIGLVAMEICIHPKIGNETVNEDRIIAALTKLREIKKTTGVKENIGNMILDKIDHILSTKDYTTVWNDLSKEEKNSIANNALQTLNRLMKKVMQTQEIT